MPTRLPNLSRESSQSLRLLQQQVRDLQTALGRLRDGTAGLAAAIHAPKIRAGSRYTKAQHSQPSALLRAGEKGIAGFFTQEIFGGGGDSLDSFYTSASQSASSLIDALRRGQRLR